MVMVEDFEEILCLFSDLYTFLLLGCACWCVLFLFSSYIVVQFLRSAWISFLEKRFPGLEFVRGENLSASVDTKRNIGVVATLLTVRERCDVAYIKRKLEEEVIEKRLEDGRLAYRHLRKTLTTRWGKYAWMNAPFSIDNHVSVGWSVYRGRPVCELNIQECVCELVSKYLADDVPPWHLTIIPTSSERYYLLLRIHHLLLSDATGLRLGDFLPVTSVSRDTRHFSVSTPWDTTPRPHPFLNLYKPPQAVPALLDQLSQAFSNRWNEFLAVHDPVENPSALKKPTLRSILAVLLISLISSLKQKLNGCTPASTIYQRRSLSLQLFLTCLWNSFGPFAITGRLLHLLLRSVKFVVVTLPVICVCECWAMWKINDEQYSDRSFIKMILDGWCSIQGALREVSYFTRLCFSGPRIVVEEILGTCGLNRNYLQTVSRGGRKVVSWSVGVPIEHIRAVEEATGASCCEVVLTAAAASLRDFFLLQGRAVPNVLHSTVQAMSVDELFSNALRLHRSHGAVCLAVPTKNPWEDEDGPIAELHSMQQLLLGTRLRQPFLYLLTSLELDYGVFSKSLPVHLIRVVFNALSRRFPVSITEVSPPLSGECHKLQLWGQDVESFMYWNPPQANVRLSLTLMSDGNTVSIGVMGDSQLSPHHSIISSTFPGHIRRLATAAGVVLEPRRIPVPVDDSDESGGSRTPQSMSSSSEDFDLGENDEENGHFLNKTNEYRLRFSSKS